MSARFVRVTRASLTDALGNTDNNADKRSASAIQKPTIQANAFMHDQIANALPVLSEGGERPQAWRFLSGYAHTPRHDAGVGFEHNVCTVEASTSKLPVPWTDALSQAFVLPCSAALNCYRGDKGA